MFPRLDADIDEDSVVLSLNLKFKICSVLQSSSRSNASSPLAPPHRELDLRQNLVGTGFLDIKKGSKESRVTCMGNKATSIQLGEIVSAIGFQHEKTYCFFETFIPEGWTFEDDNKYETLGVVREDTTEFNKRCSSTHISKGTVEELDGEDVNVSHFCFPFDFQFLVNEKASKIYCLLYALSVEKRPYLLIQVNSVDSWQRHRIEGYGFVRLPTDPGYHEIEVDTWRPRGSLKTEIFSFFLGGSIRIMKLEELIRTRYIDEEVFSIVHFNHQGRADVVNRFGLETEDSGKVRVNLNICYQNYITKKAHWQEHNIIKQKEQMATKRRVMDYKIEQVKLANKMLAEAKDPMAGQYQGDRPGEDIYHESNNPAIIQ